jgi:uncharacterized membrane protein
MHSYTIAEWITFFLIYAFMGWIYETCLVSVREKKFVNRGFLRGPIIPIYGFGAVMMLFMAMPFRESYIITFFVGVIGATVLEYVTGWAMERLFKVRYWDYTKNRYNINGYICLDASMMWGVMTVLLTEIMQPAIDGFIQLHINDTVKNVFVIIAGVLFITDTITSGKAAFDFGKTLEKMAKIRGEIEGIQVQMSLLKMETADYIENSINEARLKAMSAKEESLEKLEKLKELTQKRTELLSVNESIVKGMNFMQKGLLRGNPTATAAKFEKSLKELKERFIK